AAALVTAPRRPRGSKRWSVGGRRRPPTFRQSFTPSFEEDDRRVRLSRSGDEAREVDAGTRPARPRTPIPRQFVLPRLASTLDQGLNEASRHVEEAQLDILVGREAITDQSNARPDPRREARDIEALPGRA